MIGTVLTATLSVAQLPCAVPVPQALECAEIEVVVQTTLDHFSAANESFLEQLLLFGSEEQGMIAALRLGPGGRVVYPFPRGTVDELWVDVVALDGQAWRTTGALSLARVRDSAARTLWIQAGPERSAGWVLDGEDLAHLSADGALCSDAMRRAHPELESYEPLPPTHVPVPVPVDEDKEAPPPVLDKKPLPPV